MTDNSKTPESNENQPPSREQNDSRGSFDSKTAINKQQELVVERISERDDFRENLNQTFKERAELFNSIATVAMNGYEEANHIEGVITKTVDGVLPTGENTVRRIVVDTRKKTSTLQSTRRQSKVAVGKVMTASEEKSTAFQKIKELLETNEGKLVSKSEIKETYLTNERGIKSVKREVKEVEETSNGPVTQHNVVTVPDTTNTEDFGRVLQCLASRSDSKFVKDVILIETPLENEGKWNKIRREVIVTDYQERSELTMSAIYNAKQTRPDNEFVWKIVKISTTSDGQKPTITSVICKETINDSKDEKKINSEVTITDRVDDISEVKIQRNSLSFPKENWMNDREGSFLDLVAVLEGRGVVVIAETIQKESDKSVDNFSAESSLKKRSRYEEVVDKIEVIEETETKRSKSPRKSSGKSATVGTKVRKSQQKSSKQIASKVTPKVSKPVVASKKRDSSQSSLSSDKSFGSTLDSDKSIGKTEPKKYPLPKTSAEALKMTKGPKKQVGKDNTKNKTFIKIDADTKEEAVKKQLEQQVKPLPKTTESIGKKQPQNIVLPKQTIETTVVSKGKQSSVKAQNKGKRGADKSKAKKGSKQQLEKEKDKKDKTEEDTKKKDKKEDNKKSSDDSNRKIISMLCAKCGINKAILKRPKTADALCQSCFFDCFEDEIHATITKCRLFKRGQKVAIGASGGKDSTVLAYVLKTLNDRHDYGLELVLLSIDEGISGYRDDSLLTVKRNELSYGLPLKILSYKELYGWSMDEIVKTVGLKNNCTFCGVFRRQALDRGAALLKCDVVVTGHNADDVAETVLMNVLRGDTNRLQRSTNIVTGGDEEHSTIPRCKPLKYAYEKEIVMYAYFKKLDYFSTECTYSPNSYRGHVRAYLKDIESIKPSAILDIIYSGETMAVKEGVRVPVQGNCTRCGYISSQNICKACIMLEGLNKGLPRLGIGKSSKVKLIKPLNCNENKCDCSEMINKV
ncbi:cytoplasmic tRNA 2-thiolation protein 1-like protein [Leptotrombidium deliense]|uniref:Cytoplasmic tRNA 2-thiolation protein 1 n=1 Tax=Leptotrombidium deliense TaxID=299467 RepID=A0A443SVL9_9ACAR|nr:cytoplasmic tRNA 2-thiolation protein 1-like protein [Leptotrombidium deliense]